MRSIRTSKSCSLWYIACAACTCGRRPSAISLCSAPIPGNASKVSIARFRSMRLRLSCAAPNLEDAYTEMNKRSASASPENRTSRFTTLALPLRGASIPNLVERSLADAARAGLINHLAKFLARLAFFLIATHEVPEILARIILLAGLYPSRNELLHLVAHRDGNRGQGKISVFKHRACADPNHSQLFLPATAPSRFRRGTASPRLHSRPCRDRPSG